MRPTLRLSTLLACGLCTLAVAATASASSSKADTSDEELTIYLDDLEQSSSYASALAEPNEGERKRICKFSFGQREFDLCPIFDYQGEGKQGHVRSVWMSKETPPTVTHMRYSISLRGKLQKNESRPDEEQCTDGSWICMTVVNYAAGKKEPWRVTQVIPVAGRLPLAENHTRTAHPGLNATVRAGYKHKDADSPDLTVTLHGGMYAGRNLSASLYFHCNASVEEPSKPTFGWEYRGFHVFHWATKHACGRSLAPEPEPQPTPNKPTPDPTPETPPDNIPADQGGGGGNADDDGQDFVIPPDSLDGKRRVGVLGVLGAIALTATLLYLLHTHFSRLHALFSPYVRLPSSLPSLPTIKSPILSSFPTLKSPRSFKRSRKGFRPHAGRLRAWAAEDRVLDDAYERGLLADMDGESTEGLDLGSEEDFMVNASAGRSKRGDVLFSSDEGLDPDEEMPLSPSPRKFFAGHKGPVKGYGSAG